jgi:hypothetical protein
MLWGLRKLKPEHWDWAPDQAAPTPRTVAVHAWQWLMCDRQHIDEPDFARHTNVPEPPEDIDKFCEAFAEETENWRQLLRRLTPEDLVKPRNQFGQPDAHMNIRFFIGHMVQNLIYKHGQFAEVFFALGYDGTEPYSAPFPNAIYDEVRAQIVATGI